MNSKYHYPFLGLILALFFPGAAHILSGHWKTGIAWYFGSLGGVCLCLIVLSLSISLSFGFIIAIQLLVIIYVVSLFICSYRPIRRLGCGGWIVFLFIACTANIISASIVDIVRTHIGRVSIGIGPCMYPTLKSTPPDITASNMLVYQSSPLQRGDIVRVGPDQNGRLWAKRVVGLPGETVEIQPPYVLIDGEKLLDPPIFSKISSRAEGYAGYVNAEDMGFKGIALPITLGTDEYFLLGDNSPKSGDSRLFGPVSRENIHGKVMRVVFPPWRIREL